MNLLTFEIVGATLAVGFLRMNLPSQAWTKTNAPDSVSITDFATLPDGNILASWRNQDDSGGVLVSHDGGHTWIAALLGDAITHLVVHRSGSCIFRRDGLVLGWEPRRWQLLPTRSEHGNVDEIVASESRHFDHC